LTYQAPGITVRSEQGTSVVTAEAGVSAVHLANTIAFSVPPTCALNGVETDEHGRLVLTFVAAPAPYIATPLEGYAVPAAPAGARRAT